MRTEKTLLRELAYLEHTSYYETTKRVMRHGWDGGDGVHAEPCLRRAPGESGLNI